MRDYLLLTNVIKRFLKEERSYNPKLVKLYRGDDNEGKSSFFTSYRKDLKYYHIKIEVKYDGDNLSKVQIIENGEIVFIKEGKSLKQYLMEIKLRN